jgi:PKD repeat protein
MNKIFKMSLLAIGVAMATPALYAQANITGNGGNPPNPNQDDLVLGFTSTYAGVANDYIIDLGQVPTTTTQLGNNFSLTTFNSIFSSALAAGAVNVGVVGGGPNDINGNFDVDTSTLVGAAGPKHSVDQTIDNASQTIISLQLGEVAQNNLSSWTSLIAATPTAVGTAHNNFTSDLGEANPLQSLSSSGSINLEIWNVQDAGNGEENWTSIGYVEINVSGSTLSAIYTKTAPVSSPVVSAITSTVTNGFSPLTAVFTNSATGSITNWVWNFGNGTIITNTTAVSVTNTYSGIGDYNVTLTVYGPNGSSTLTVTNLIVTSPVPKIGTSLSSGKFVLGGTNCPVGVKYRILTSTNLALPLASWQPVLTNTFLSNGSFSYTNAATNATSFFQLISP